MHSAHRKMLICPEDVFYKISECVFITSKGISSNSTVISEHTSVNNNIHYVNAAFNIQR